MKASDEDSISTTSGQDSLKIVILHERLSKKREDRFVLNLAQALESLSYSVTVLTSDCDMNCMEGENFTGLVVVENLAKWIPRHVLGMFRNTFSFYKSFVMAMKLIFSKICPQPGIIIVDTNPIALFLIKKLTKHKVFFIEHFRELEHTEICLQHVLLQPNLLHRICIKYADEIIVQSQSFLDIFHRTYGNLPKPKVLAQCIDIGLWKQPPICLDRIVPDITKESIVFLTVGKFRFSSNFRLCVDAFEDLVDQTKDMEINKRLLLIIAGNCKNEMEYLYYENVITYLKSTKFASQVTVLRQLPIVHQKTLIMESTVIVHPAKNDVVSDFLLCAMSLGKPIIASNRGLAAKILENKITAVLVEPSPSIFAASMLKVATCPHIQGFIGEMARDVFNYKYSFDSFTRKIGNMVFKHTHKFSDIEKDTTASEKSVESK